MNLKAQSIRAQNPSTAVRLRCPLCRQRGAFEPVGTQDLFLQNDNVILGIRRCPDPNCHGLVFFALKAHQIIDSYPAETIDFDPTNVPTAVQNALEEAIKCHAQRCFIATAIMVRKTLEELCKDRNATGGNLKERITALGSKVVLPAELLAGLDDLRLLGNDAAHIESEEYNKVGQEEAEIGVEFTKEVLKAVYQYGALLKRLQSLKKTP